MIKTRNNIQKLNFKYIVIYCTYMVDIKIGGSLAVALALFAFLSITTGLSFNEIIEGLGSILIWIGGIVIVILIIVFILKNI